jgi:hypothetical protein
MHAVAIGVGGYMHWSPSRLPLGVLKLIDQRAWWHVAGVAGSTVLRNLNSRLTTFWYGVPTCIGYGGLA